MSFITVNRIGGTKQPDGSITGGAITGTYNGKSFGIQFSQERWDIMQQLKNRANAAQSMDELKGIFDEFEPLTHESYKELVETQSQYLQVNKATNRFFLKYNQVVSKEPLPTAFVDRILQSIEKGIDPKPLVKAWARFLRNPNYSSKKAELFAWYINQTYTNSNQVQKLISEGLAPEVATQIATTFQTPITEEGLICTYKVSKEITKKYVKDKDAEGGVKKEDRYDYDVDEDTGFKTYNEPESVEDRIFEPAVMHQTGDAFSLFEIDGTPFKADTHIIKVGKVHALKDWKQVNCDDRASGVKGLHCGNLDYIRCYQTEGTVTHEVLVDPMDIGAIVQDNTGALRVKSYMVWRSFVGVTKSLYHSATYAALKDSEYAALVADVVQRTRDEQIAAANEAFEQKVGLAGNIAD